MNKKRAALGAAAVLVLLAAFFVLWPGREIGSLLGPEQSSVLIGGELYRKTEDADAGEIERGRLLGTVVSTDRSAAKRVYAVKGADRLILAVSEDGEEILYERIETLPPAPEKNDEDSERSAS